MTDKAKPLKIELKKVKRQISKYEAMDTRSDAQEATLARYLEKKKRLNDEIDTLEGLLFIVSHFTELCWKRVIKLIHKCG